MPERPDVTTFDGRQAVISIAMPDPEASIRVQVGFIQRLSEQLYVLATALRIRGQHIAAHEVEHAAMGLVSGADQQRQFLDTDDVRALLGAADPTPKAGDRVQDGGQWGTLIRCPQCDGDGLLHQLDPDELARMATARPSSAFEVDSLPVAGPSCGATLGDRCLIKGHPEECEAN